MLRFDDQFPLHRKVDGLSDSGFRVHVEAIFWCARNLTDGFIAQDDIHVVSRYRKPESAAAECVRREAWHRILDGAITDCAQCADRYGNTLMGDGWLIHGYLDWQLPRSKMLQIRLARQKAGKLGGLRSGQVRKGFASRSDAGLLRGKRSTNPQATTPPKAPVKQPAKQVARNDDEPPIPSPSKEGNRGSPPADAGRAGHPSKPEKPPPPPPTAEAVQGNGTLDRATAIALARQAAKRTARVSMQSPFLPPADLDKPEAALAALDAALARTNPSPEGDPPP